MANRENKSGQQSTEELKDKKIDKSKKGCAVSFLNEERGELDPLCERTPEERDEEYVQPRKEKEAGGEG